MTSRQNHGRTCPGSAQQTLVTMENTVTVPNNTMHYDQEHTNKTIAFELVETGEIVYL